MQRPRPWAGALLLAPTLAFAANAAPAPLPSPAPARAPAPAPAHGGTFRAPPLPDLPGTGGLPQMPNTPGQGVTADPKSPGGILGAESDLAGWQLWWAHNRDPFLDLKAAVQGVTTTTLDDAFYLGAGQRVGQQTWRPNRSVIHGKVVPALLAVLERERQKDLQSAALLALAKIGDEGTDLSPSRFVDVIRPFLADANVEVQETAAVALGVLAHPAAAPLLAELVHDTSLGRRAVESSRVPRRVRAFAAYGLGLLGHRSAKEDVRRYAVHHLQQALALADEASRDLAVACTLSLGILPLAATGEPVPAGDAAELPWSPGASRETQVRFLLERLAARGADERVVGHAPVALARLAGGLHPSWRELLVARFTALCDPRGRTDENLQQGAAIALGLLADGDEDEADAAARAALLGLGEGGDRIVRHLALVSLARIAARPGDGAGPDAALPVVRGHLLRLLARGKSAERPWAALALGLLERTRAAEGLETSPDVRRALAAAFDGAKSPLEAGGYAIGAGLAGARDAVAPLLERIGGGDEELRGHVAIALGLLKAREAVPPVRGVVAGSIWRPHVLREAATALGMLEDEQAVPLLLQMLRRADTLASQAATASALGHVGDVRAIDPLLEMLADLELSDRARAFAAVALGIICDKEPLPWNSKLAVDVNYRQPPETLSSPAAGTGVLDLL